MGTVTDGAYRSKLKEDPIIGQKQSPLFIGRNGNRGYQAVAEDTRDSPLSERHITNVTRYITTSGATKYDNPKRIGESCTHRGMTYRPCSPTPAVAATSRQERKLSIELKRDHSPRANLRRFVRTDGTPVGSPVSPGRGTLYQPAHVEYSSKQPTRTVTGGGDSVIRGNRTVRLLTGNDSPVKTPARRNVTGDAALPRPLTIRTVTDSNSAVRVSDGCRRHVIDGASNTPTRGTVTTVIRRISGSPVASVGLSARQAAFRQPAPADDLLPTFRQPPAPAGTSSQRNTMSANESAGTKLDRNVVRCVTTSHTPPINRTDRSSTPSTSTGGSEVRISLESRSKSPGPSETSAASVKIKSRVSSPADTQVTPTGRATGGTYVRTYRINSPPESGSRSRPTAKPAEFKRIVSKGGFEGLGQLSPDQPKERRKSTGCDAVKANRSRVFSYDHRTVPVIDDAFAALVESFVGKPNLKPELDTNPTDGYDPFDGEQPVIPPSTHIMLPTSYVRRLQILDSPPRQQV